MRMNRVARPAGGFSLVELMVSVVIGLAVLWGMSTVYVNTAVGGRVSSSAMQLNQDARAVMDIMVNDIRRAGFWGTAVAGTDNPFTATTTTIAISGTSNECIAYSYDATYASSPPGAVDPRDFFGFRLTAGGILQLFDPPSSSTVGSTTAVCASSTWENLTDELGIQVTGLTFDTTGSRCIAFEAAKYKPTDVNTFTQWATTSGIGRACNSAAPGPYPTPPDTFVETRQVNIILRVKSRADPTLPEVTLSETVLVRNSRVSSSP
jgi:type IV pilus assembly protein PilW